MRSCLSLVIFVLALSPGGVSVARAQDEAGKITRPMVALDPVTLQADRTRVTLWGIKPAEAPETPLGLKALDLLDGMIGRDPVTCKIMTGTPPQVTARCATLTGEDIGLELLGHGYAVVDRRQTLNSVFADAYAGAEKTARQNTRGIWRVATSDNKPGELPPLLQLLLTWGPLGGLLLIALVMHYRLKRVENLQQEELDRAQNKEKTLFLRERQVLVSTLEGELSANKNRIEAFLAIYGDMLRNLKNTAEAPKYKQTGDIVQKHPSFSKSVFEASMSKLSLLDMQLAGQLSKLYTGLPKEAEYITIEPSVPLETAVALVEKVLHDAEEMVPPIDAAIAALDEVTAKKAA